MTKGKVVLKALKSVALWAATNPNAHAIINKATQASSQKEQISIIEAKLNQLGAATLELEEKIDNEIGFLCNETEVLKKKLRTLTIFLSAMSLLFLLLIVYIFLK